MTMSLAPIIGPTIGGFLGEFAGWRANFWVYALLGSILALLVVFQLPETGGRSKGGRTSFVESYMQLLTDLHFWAYTGIMAFGIGAFYMFVSGIPLVAAQELMMDQFEIGLGMGSITVGFLIGSFVSGKISTRIVPETMILSGRVVATVGLLASACILWTGWISPWSLFGGTVFVGIGNGLTTPSASASAMFLRRELAASAAGLSGAVIAVFCATAGYVLKAYPYAIALVGLLLTATISSLAIAVWVSRRSGNLPESS